MTNAHDPLFIAGAGCAGLSLAVHLRRAGVKRPLVMADPRLDFPRDHTWCGFATGAGPFASCVDHRWSTWRVRTESDLSLAHSARHPYTHIAADRFYAAAVGELRADAGVDLRLGVGVDAIEPADDHVRVRLSDGSSTRAAAVFDSRPPPASDFLGSANDVVLFQQFVGLHVRAAFDAFRPGVMDMMDFRLPQDGQIRFVYVLPYSTTEAMVEATTFTPRPVAFAGLESATHAYLRRHLGIERPVVVHRECGTIPMTTARLPVRPHARWMKIGQAGAAAKPSTGYAFGAIQRASADIAAQLAAGVPPERLASPRHRRRRSTFLDDVFLSYLHRHPGRAPQLFARIFERCPGDVLARFLTDTGSLHDDLRVIAAMPKLPFVIEALRSARTWARPTTVHPCVRPDQQPATPFTRLPLPGTVTRS